MKSAETKIEDLIRTDIGKGLPLPDNFIDDLLRGKFLAMLLEHEADVRQDEMEKAKDEFQLMIDRLGK